MSEKENSEQLAEARAFFEQAWSAAASNDLDEAIKLHLRGLRLAPESVEGHIRLRELALMRQAKGGLKPSNAEIQRYQQGKTALEQMLGAEYLLAKAPNHLPYAQMLLKAAIEGNFKQTAKWIADLVFLANNNAKKPSLQIYLMLKDSYAAIEEFERASAACMRAAKLKPKDTELANEIKNLSAKAAAKVETVRKAAIKAKSAPKSTVTDSPAQVVSAEAAGAAAQLQASQENNEQDLAKAKAFFEKAHKAGDSNNFDYAVDLYLEGLHLAPEALQEGHIPFFELAIRRQGRSGKKPSMMERMKYHRGKTPLEQMLNAEYLFAKDPEHIPYAESMLKAAVEGSYDKTAGWLANFIFQANNAAEKPSVHTYVMLKDAYATMGQFDKALAACQRAVRLKPEDGELADEVQRLSAELAVVSGKYDQAEDFRGSIKDRESQVKLQSQEGVVKTRDYRVMMVEEARKKIARSPNLSQNIFNLADALSDMQDDKADAEAMQLLENAYRTKNDFSFKQMAGKIRIKQLKRKVIEAQSYAESHADDAQAKQLISEMREKLNNTELEHYRLVVENYPTDLRAKYDYGLRLFNSKRYDDAIPLFQESQRDPRHKISSMSKIGMCFFMKGWYADAVDILNQTINSYEIKDDAIGKELRYNLARSYEEQGEIEKALEIYRKIAQLDFAYKDVRQRVDKLRAT